MLKKAIKSVINQTYTDFNFFILDNASTDNTIDVINEFNNSSINYIRYKTNRSATRWDCNEKSDIDLLLNKEDIKMSKE